MSFTSSSFGKRTFQPNKNLQHTLTFVSLKQCGGNMVPLWVRKRAPRLQGGLALPGRSCRSLSRCKLVDMAGMGSLEDFYGLLLMVETFV